MNANKWKTLCARVKKISAVRSTILPGVRISTMEGKTLYANRAILDMYGYDKIEELENTPLQERYTPESYAEFKERKRKRLQGEFGPSEYEISIVRKDGEIRHLHVSVRNFLERPTAIASYL